MQRLTRRNGHSYFPSAFSVGRNPSFASPDSAEKLYATMADGTRRGRLQSQFRPGRRSQSQSVESGDRPARPKLRRRSQYRHHAGARLHHSRIATPISSPSPSIFPATARAMSTATRRFADISDSWKEIELEPYREPRQGGAARRGDDRTSLSSALQRRREAARLAVGPRGAKRCGRARSASTAWWSATTWRWARCAQTIRSRSG